MRNGKSKKIKGLKLYQSELSLLNNDLSIISGRIKRSDHFHNRLNAENIDLTSDEYFSRIKKKKKEIINSIEKLSLESSLPDKIHPPRNYQPLHIDIDSEARRLAERLAGYNIDWEDARRWRESQELFPVTDEQDSCPELVGFARIKNSEEITIDESSSINHGSTFNFETDESNLNTNSATLFRAELNDKASFWRNDTPDRIAFAYVISWSLPAPECDSWVTCDLRPLYSLSFYNGADDGSIQIRTMLIPIDEQANIPESFEISEGSLILDSEKSIDGFYESKYLKIRFPIKAGAIPAVALVNIIQLSAQDGLVSVIGQFRIDGSGTDSRLKYRITPKTT